MAKGLGTLTLGALRTLTASFASMPGSVFLVDGAWPDSNAAQVKVGGELALSASSALFASFDGELSGHDQLYAGKGGFKLVWRSGRTVRPGARPRASASGLGGGLCASSARQDGYDEMTAERSRRRASSRPRRSAPALGRQAEPGLAEFA